MTSGDLFGVYHQRNGHHRAVACGGQSPPPPPKKIFFSPNFVQFLGKMAAGRKFCIVDENLATPDEIPRLRACIIKLVGNNT